MRKKVTCLSGTGYSDLVLTRSIDVKEYLHLSSTKLYSKANRMENIIFYGLPLNQYTIPYWESLSKDLRVEMLVAAQFIESLLSKYGRHPVYSDGGTWYPEACSALGLKHYLNSPYEKSIVERMNQYFKDRIESFDDHYPCNRKSNCDLKHAYNWISFFILIHNATRNHKFKIGLGGEEIILN